MVVNKKKVKKVKKQAEPENLTQEAEEQIQKTLKKVGGNLSPAEKQLVEKTLRKVLIDGTPPKDAMGIGEEGISIFYNQACTQYNAGQYKQANTIFKLLTIIDPSVKNLHGLASTHHMMKEYEDAIGIYLAYSACIPESPEPYYHMYDCFANLNNSVGAGSMLKGAIRRCGDAPENAQLKTQCAALLEVLLQELGITEDEEEETMVRELAEINQTTKEEVLEKLFKEGGK